MMFADARAQAQVASQMEASRGDSNASRLVLLLHTCLQESQLCIDNIATADRLAEELKKEHQPLVMKGRYASSFKTQFSWLMRKWGITYWRSPAYNLTRMLMTSLIALFYGTMYLNKGKLRKTGEGFLAGLQSYLVIAHPIQRHVQCGGPQGCMLQLKLSRSFLSLAGSCN